ncbi:MAG: HU family DNA-binding protein [Deltaproteobacteria bacterium]|nr:HU family DNA-binding protein [Deltaproteobacteria bacterium]
MKASDTEGLTRAEIIQNLNESLSISRRDAKVLLDTFLEIVSDGLEDGARVTLPELGQFQVKRTPERPGRNPKTGMPHKVPARNRICFTVSPVLRAAMATWQNMADNKGPGPGSLEMATENGELPNGEPPKGAV